MGPATLAHGSTELALRPDTFVDVDALIRGTPQEAVAIPALGRELLEGMEIGNSPAFETWLLGERRRLLGAAEAALHEASLDRLAAGEAVAAVGLAARLVELNPYDENFQELLVRSYSEAGDREAANRQVSACVALFRAEYGRDPGAGVFRAAEARRPARVPVAGPAGKQAARARLEAGRSAINAGSFEPGVRSLARAAAEAKACGAHELEAESWLALGTALVHSARGRDEEGADALFRASSLAEERGLGDLAAAAHRELAYVDILQARYARCAQRLERAGALADSDEERAGVEAMLGLAAADTGAHERALAHLRRSVELADAPVAASRLRSRCRSSVAPISCARSSTMPGRCSSARSPSRARQMGRLEPWPESWLAEVDLAAGQLPAGRERFEHAWALASELGDPCWEGAAGQGLGRIACLEGQVPTGLRLLEEARRRAASFPDTYVWVEASRSRSSLRRPSRPDTAARASWVEDLTSLSARTGMRELAVRAYLLRETSATGALWTRRRSWSPR